MQLANSLLTICVVAIADLPLFLITFVQLAQISSNVDATEEVYQQEVISEAREGYQALYAEEEGINATFRRFVLNYKAAHEGRNTRKHQLKDIVKKHQIYDRDLRKQLQTLVIFPQCSCNYT